MFGELACTLKNPRNSWAGPATRACSSSTVHVTAARQHDALHPARLPVTIRHML